MKNVEDLYPLTPLQKGMLFHTLLAPESAVYVSQLTCTLPADLDPGRFRQAWETLVRRHGALRTAFLWEGLDEPLQAVRKTVSGKSAARKPSAGKGGAGRAAAPRRKQAAAHSVTHRKVSKGQR